MHAGRCTLRNIAQRCEVSIAVVSTVLNNRQGRITCSDIMRKKILETARQMNYVPNVLARSMRQKRVPLVGVFLRQRLDNYASLSSNIKMLANSTLALNKNSYETIFVPFSNETGQLERMKSLASAGLIGGIITSVINEECREVCSFLKKSPLPYLILGNPPEEEVYCLYSSDRITSQRYLAFAAQKGLKYCFSAAPDPKKEGAYIYRSLPYPNDFIWDAPPVSFEEVFQKKEESLMIVMGMDICRHLVSLGFDSSKFVIMEYNEDREKVPGDLNACFVKRTSDLADDIDDFFIPWLLKEKRPLEFRRCTGENEQNFEFRLK